MLGYFGMPSVLEYWLPRVRRGTRMETPFVAVYCVMLGFFVMAMVLFPFIRTNPRDRILPRVPGEWFRVRVFGRLFRVARRPTTTKGPLSFRLLSQMEEHMEWTHFVEDRYRYVRFSLDLSPVL